MQKTTDSQEAALVDAALPQIGASRRGFVVEADPLISTDIECTLGECGFDVLGSANRLADAIDYVVCNSGKLDFALLDVELAGQSCLPLAETLEGFGIPYLLVTAHSEDVVRALGFRAQVVEKPFQNGDLAARVSDLLA